MTGCTQPQSQPTQDSEPSPNRPATVAEAVDEADGQLTDSCSFGIGCLYFGVALDQIENWPKLVTATLKALPSVSRIKVEADMSDGYITHRSATLPISAFVSFKVRISRAVQERLSPARMVSKGTTYFTVRTYYEYHAPATFIT